MIVSCTYIYIKCILLHIFPLSLFTYLNKDCYNYYCSPSYAIVIFILAKSFVISYIFHPYFDSSNSLASLKYWNANNIFLFPLKAYLIMALIKELTSWY